jgi:hypothetical protein
MTKQLLLATALAVVASPAAFALPEADCKTLWQREDVAKNGMLSAPYAEAYTKSGRTIPSGGMIDSAAFLDACKADAFKVVARAPEMGAPLAGANSFTQTQAQDRIEKAGFTNVTGLKKDENGVWRGAASQGGKTLAVALDFKGNVVAQ